MIEMLIAILSSRRNAYSLWSSYLILASWQSEMIKMEISDNRTVEYTKSHVHELLTPPELPLSIDSLSLIVIVSVSSALM